MQVFLLPALLLCLATQGAARPGLTKTEDQSPHIKLGHFKIKLFPFPHLVSNEGDNTRRRVGGFFSDNPLISVKRSFQVNNTVIHIDIVNNLLIACIVYLYFITTNLSDNIYSDGTVEFH